MSIVNRIKDFLAGTNPGQRRPDFGELRPRRAPPRRPSRGKHSAPEPKEPIEPTDEFALVLSLIRASAPFVLVMGQAGTGKTTLIRWLREELENNVVVVAPTGLAALTAGGQTIHSFFGFPPRYIEREDIRPRRDPAIYEKMEYLLIDEISMVSCRLLDAIDQFLRINRKQEKKPFGGVQVVALGDLYQLPPVITRDDRARLREKYRHFHFFGAHCLTSVVPATVELTRPFRQKDPHFLDLLRSVRENRDLESALHELNTQCFEPQFDDADWLVVVPKRDQAERLNQGRLDALPGESREYVGELAGRFLGRTAQANAPTHSDQDKNLPSPYRLRLKPGARVIFTKNDPRRRWVNGTMGTVQSCADDEVTVIADEAGEQALTVSKAKWSKEVFKVDRETEKIGLEEIGSYQQLPLAPAWAITIHKVQGQTLSRLIVDLQGGAFAAGQTYVAISRCRSMEGLRLRRQVQVSDVQTDPDVREFVDAVQDSLANRMLDE